MRSYNKARAFMKNLIDHRLTATALLASGVVWWMPAARAASADEARVTRVIREVNLLPSQAKPRPAALNDKVRDGTGVRTGDASRSELTFPDLTIERLGSNTV